MIPSLVGRARSAHASGCGPVLVRRREGTCTFLIFLSDFCGYGATITFLFVRNFVGLGEDVNAVLGTYLVVVTICASVNVVLIFSVAVHFVSRTGQGHQPLQEASTAIEDDIVLEEDSNLLATSTNR